MKEWQIKFISEKKNDGRKIIKRRKKALLQ